MKTGDQFHDTLHQTRVRLEVSANERNAFVSTATSELAAIQARHQMITEAARRNQRECVECFQKANARYQALLARAQQALENALAENVDLWYPHRDLFIETVKQLHKEMHTVESLSNS